MLHSGILTPVIPAREKEREDKRLKKEQAAESKKRKAAEAAEAKKAAKPSGRRRKSKRGQHDDSAASDDPAADGSKAKAAKVSRTRAKGSFEESDPPVLVKGSMFPAAYRLGFFESFNDFLDQVVCNKPAVMRNKKGSVKKVLSKSLNRNDPNQETEAKDFITQTAKAFGVQQASAKSDLQKLAAIGPVRKNKTVPQEKEVAMFLGFDLLLKAKLVARHGFHGDGDGDGPGGNSGEAGGSGECEEEPWLLCREALVKKVQSFLSLRCTLASSLPLSLHRIATDSQTDRWLFSAVQSPAVWLIFWGGPAASPVTRLPTSRETF